MVNAAIRRLSALYLGGLLGSLAVSQNLVGQNAADHNAAAHTDVVQPAAELVQAVRDELAAAHDAGKFPGATLAFVLPDRSCAAVAVGMADVEAARPMTIEDRLMSGSIGKTYFVTVMLLAVAAGELDLDAKIADTVGNEEWFESVPNGSDLTLRMLLRHQSGIREHVYNPDFLKTCREQPDKEWQPAELIALTASFEPLFAAGEGFAYADTNYILAGIVHETATGRRIYDDVRVRLLEPLDLAATLPAIRRDLPGLAPGYSSPDSPFGIPGKVIGDDGRFVINPQLEWTGGGFYLTSLDLARWGHALYRGDVLAAEQFTEMMQTVPFRGADRYGLGVITWDSPLGPAVGHSGWFPGYVAQLTYYQDHGIAVALQINSDDVRAIGRPLRAICDAAARRCVAALGR